MNRSTFVLGACLLVASACANAAGVDKEPVALFAHAAGEAAPPCTAQLRTDAGDPRQGFTGLASGFECLAAYHDTAYPASAALYRLAAAMMSDAAADPATIEASEAWHRAEAIRDAAATRVREAERAQAQAERDAERARDARRSAAIAQGFRAAMSIASAAATEDASEITAAVGEAVVTTAAVVIEAQAEAREADAQIEAIEDATSEIREAYQDIVSAVRSVSFDSPVGPDYAGDRLIVARLVALRMLQNPEQTLGHLEQFGRSADVGAIDPYLMLVVTRARPWAAGDEPSSSGATVGEGLEAVVERIGQLEVAVAKYERWGRETPAAQPPPSFAAPLEEATPHDVPPAPEPAWDDGSVAPLESTSPLPVSVPTED